MTLDEIFEKENISVRSYNVCKDNGLTSVEALKEYYNEHQSFTDLRNCGRKSDEELIGICKKYFGGAEDYVRTNLKKEHPLKKVVSSLTRTQRDVINSFISINSKNLSVRSKNAISSYLDWNLKIKNFAEKILLNESFKLSKIRSIGRKSIPELDQYISSIQEFLLEVNQLSSENELTLLKNKFLIQKKFSFVDIPSQLLESNSILSITDFLIAQNALFDKTQTVVFIKSLKIYGSHEKLTLDQIAEIVDLTRERVRQIKVKCLDELFDNLLFIQNFNDDLYQKYGIDFNSNQIDVDDELTETINLKSSTKLAKEFITYLLYVYVSDTFSLIGRVEDVMQAKYFTSSGRHNWNNFYIVRKDLNAELDFEAFANDVSKRLSERIDQTYSFNLKSYLSRFLTRKNINVLSEVLPIGEKILNDEFDLYLDLDENIIFERNTPIQAYEYAFEALEELGEPSKVQVIYEKILELYPNYETNESKVRSSMKRKDGFVPIGRKSVFGLKKWEDELEGFKGGTIRDIVREYLAQFSVPKHIADITEHVLIYRPRTNEYSISQNLKLDESGDFIFYEDSLIGLSFKKYGEQYIESLDNKSNGKRSWEQSYDTLQKFINENDRLPYSSNVPYSEERLYRWLNIQKHKVRNGELDEDKVSLIENIDDQISDLINRKVSKSLNKYDELISFVKNNHRLPSAHKEGENRLYSFFYQQRKLLETDDLSKREKSMLREVIKLIQAR